MGTSALPAKPVPASTKAGSQDKASVSEAKPFPVALSPEPESTVAEVTPVPESTEPSEDPPGSGSVPMT
jgi:hypothetical protein